MLRYPILIDQKAFIKHFFTIICIQTKTRIKQLKYRYPKTLTDSQVLIHPPKFKQ